jgi:predicted DCC family thiol-disulfide oxidoreductase YuxK
VTRAALVYDGQCGLCRAVARGARALDRRRNLLPVAAQSAEGHELTHGMSEEERLASFHLVEGGEVTSGPDALAPTLRLIPALRPAASLLEHSHVASRAAAAVYHWVTPRRHRLARFLPERWKRPL